MYDPGTRSKDGGNAGEGVHGRGDKGEKKWDNWNGIINKIYLKKEGK